jgi:2-oxoglutarate dehydrogenase E2 component (dihydrolipoamide succinyltransferase)
MRVDVIMPQMGESIAEGTLTRWLKKPGDKVARDEPIFEISTDKVDAEIPAPAAGTLLEIKVKEGETVPINTVVALIETDALAAAKGASGEPRSAAPPAATGPAPAPPAPPAAAPSVPRPQAGPAPAPGAAARGGATVEELRRTRSSPVVRKIAREHNVDIGRLQGTGISGRVTRKDILAAIEAGGGRAAASAPGTAARPPAPAGAARPVFAPGERVMIEPMSAMRRKIAEHMVLSRRTSAHVTTVFEIDMSRVMRLREEHRATFQERHGVKLTVTPFLVKAAVDALKAFPVVNSSLDGDNIVYRKDINVGIAVALDWGLIVPVVKNADDRSLSGIAKAVTDLAERARSKKLTPDDVQGGTFTITNPGAFGAEFGTPIINQPQIAIMGVGSITRRPVVVENDAIGIRPMVHLSLSFDHRVLDGAIADQFMAHVKATLQEGRFPEIV